MADPQCRDVNYRLSSAFTEVDELRAVQRRCAGDFRLAERAGNCECSRRRRAWFLLGVADYLMEEILL